jgi:hypothetical protein
MSVPMNEKSLLEAVSENFLLKKENIGFIF